MSRFYFVGHYHAAAIEVANYLKDHGMIVEKIANHREIDKSKPYQKCVIIFSNAKEALEFLAQASLPEKTFCALVTEREGVFKKKEALDTFKSLGLEYYTPKMMSRLLEDLNRFLLETINSDELEFSVQLELERD